MTLQEIIKDSNTTFIDVRTASEFKTGHVEGAVNIPLDQFPCRYKDINGLGNKPVVFYCRSGNRSSQAMAYLKKLGVGNIYDGGSVDFLRRALD